MKTILIIVFNFLFLNFLFGKTDTTFSGNKMFVYSDISDTVFEAYYKLNGTYFKYLDSAYVPLGNLKFRSILRRYYREGTVVTDELLVDNINGEHHEILRSRDVLLKRDKYMDSLSIRIRYVTDTFDTTEKFYVSIPDERNGMKKHLFYIAHNEGSSRERFIDLSIGETANLTVDFYEQNTIKSLALSNKPYYQIVVFYPNGSVKESGVLLQDVGRVGYWDEYYDNGMLKSSGQYCETKITYSQEVKDGIKWRIENPEYIKDGMWIYYNEDGALVTKEEWKEGVKIK